MPRLVTPELAERDTDADHTFQGHNSEEIANALAAHSQKMDELAKELSASSSTSGARFQGHDSSDIAKAIQSYVVGHQDQPWSQHLSQAVAKPDNGGQLSSVPDNRILAITPSVSSSLSPATLLAPVVSISDLVHGEYWMSILLCIVWVVSGLFLLFFGWASLFWGINLGNSRKRVEDKKKRASRCMPLFGGAPIAGGVGGIVVGFLFLSFLAVVITSAICVTEVKAISSTSFFIIWLLPGLLGAFFAGHWPLFARAFTGLLAGACFTLVITAMFGIHSLTIRAILISVSTTLITCPLLLPRRNVIHFHLLNVCTSIIGMVTFLDGVALFAPPRASSSAWIDLWVLLFAANNSTSELSASKKWGTASFKGFIAAAVLGAVVGSLFELVFHKHAAEDPDLEWNNYLGTFTERLETHDSSPLQSGLGSFEPAPTAWQKISRIFASRTQPAAYGNISTAIDLEKSPLTNLPGSRARRQSRPARAVKARREPARFQALDKRDMDLELAESDSDATDYDSDSSLHKLDTLGKRVSARSLLSKTDGDELADQLRPLSASGDANSDNAGRLHRPPSYRTSTNSGSSTTGSDLSGTTANSAGGVSRQPQNSGPVDKVTDGGSGRVCEELGLPTRPDLSRQTTMSPPPPFRATTSQPGSPLPASIPATPSLVNAITRIQAAQAQARAWYENRQEFAISSDTKPLDVQSEQERCKSTSKGSSEGTGETSPSTGAVAASVKPEGESFHNWWGKQVKRGSKPST